MVTSAFDQDPLAHDEDPFGPTVVNKTGTNLGVRADVGLVTANERTLAYAVIAIGMRIRRAEVVPRS